MPVSLSFLTVPRFTQTLMSLTLPPLPEVLLTVCVSCICFHFCEKSRFLDMKDGDEAPLFHGRIFSSFLSSCLLEAITLDTIDGYSKHYEKYQFTLIKDRPVVLEVKCIPRVMQAHRPRKGP